MERYSKYKDSGVQWIGEVPSHWDIIKAKYLWSEVFSFSENGSEELLSVSQYDGVTQSKSESRSESLRGYKKVVKDNLVINIMLAWMGGLGVSEYNGIVSPAYCIYRLKKEANSKFMHYLYKTPMYLAEFTRRSTGVIPSRWRMYTDDFGQVMTILPPIKEQNKIVSYLDEITAKIDEAIAQQQKMIELLNERKQIIINNAVTKGLNPDAPLKDSGVEWIGEIPEHWEIKKLKMIGITKNGISRDSSYFGYGSPFVSYSDVYKNLVLPDNVEKLAMSSSDEQKLYSVEEGDVFFTRTSETIEEIGLTSVCTKTITGAVFSGFLIRFRPKKDILDNSFSKYYFRAHVHRFYFVKEMNLVTRASLNQQLLGNMPVLIPPLEEQRNISVFLDREVGEINRFIDISIKMVSLLQERKQIMINDVVTGKKKVSL